MIILGVRGIKPVTRNPACPPCKGTGSRVYATDPLRFVVCEACGGTGEKR